MATKKEKTMAEVTKDYEKFIAGKKIKKSAKPLFEKTLKKAAKPKPRSPK